MPALLFVFVVSTAILLAWASAGDRLLKLSPWRAVMLLMNAMMGYPVNDILLGQAATLGETEEEKVADVLFGCGVKNVIMKIGKRGCYIRNADGAMIVPAAKGITAIDTIGAGDNFASGFITGLLDGKDLRECGIYANCTAAVSVQYVGATTGVQNRQMVEDMLAKYREDYK